MISFITSFMARYRHFEKFAIVGSTCTGINYGIFFILFSLLHVHYVLSAIIAYILSLKVGFQLNRLWTFKHLDPSRGYWRIFVRYIIVYLVSLMISMVILWFLVEQLNIHPLIADLVAIGQSTITNFTGLNLFVFHKQTHTATASEY